MCTKGDVGVVTKREVFREGVIGGLCEFVETLAGGPKKPDPPIVSCNLSFGGKLGGGREAGGIKHLVGEEVNVSGLPDSDLRPVIGQRVRNGLAIKAVRRIANEADPGVRPGYDKLF